MVVALQYAVNTGAEQFGVAYAYLTTGGYGWGGSIGAYKAGYLD